jgi:hypothetical protein
MGSRSRFLALDTSALTCLARLLLGHPNVELVAVTA